MSEKMTRIKAPGQKSFTGLQDWGVKSAAEMVQMARSYADRLRAEAAAIDATPDEGFQIDVVRGPWVQHHVKTVQQAKSHDDEAAA